MLDDEAAVEGACLCLVTDAERAQWKSGVTDTGAETRAQNNFRKSWPFESVNLLRIYKNDKIPKIFC